MRQRSANKHARLRNLDDAAVRRGGVDGQSPPSATLPLCAVSRYAVGAIALLTWVAIVTAGAPAEARPALAQASRALDTAVMDPTIFPSDQPAAAFRQARGTGARLVRLVLVWSAVAPYGAEQPAGFDPRNPDDPHYQWRDFDRQVKAGVEAGTTPIISIVDAPRWAQSAAPRRPIDGAVQPSPEALADFATATARRYSGRFQGLPRVRYWQVWNEPNLSVFLMPQIEGRDVVSPSMYRSMVNAAAEALHAVRHDNVVIAGGLAPFGGIIRGPDSDRHQERIAPLRFMREMLCMSKGAKPKPTCSSTSEFDVWSHHPYTNGGPTHSAADPDDVSLGDLDEMRVLLDAAERAGRIKSRGGVGFWVTEFSYDSQPGDPRGLPPTLHARWVSEALYRMWSDGVSLVTWFLLRDRPFPQEMFQSGLYTKDDKPKPALRAFRFPFVAFAQPGSKIAYWGRTPFGNRKTVLVEQKQGSRWRLVARLRTDRYGIFAGAVASPAKRGFLRARISGSEASLPFSLTVPKDFTFCPFGSGC